MLSPDCSVADSCSKRTGLVAAVDVMSDMLEPPLALVAVGFIRHHSSLIINLDILGIHHRYRFEPWGVRVAPEEPHYQYLAELLYFFYDR